MGKGCIVFQYISSIGGMILLSYFTYLSFKKPQQLGIFNKDQEAHAQSVMIMAVVLNVLLWIFTNRKLKKLKKLEGGFEKLPMGSVEELAIVNNTNPGGMGIEEGSNNSIENHDD